VPPHEDENAYESLAVAAGDPYAGERWAFGTGFDDPLAGVDTTVPPGVDARALARECLALGDDALILSQRLALWVSNAHELEDEVALANIALDLLGQARLLLARAAQADASLRPPNAPAHIPDEDALAYWRDAPQFTNVWLAELDDEHDFAKCVARLFVLSTWRLAVLTRLVGSPDPVLSAIAAKAVAELSYHREYAAGWVIRLGDGTDLSHARMHDAMAWAWFRHFELFQISDGDVCGEVSTVVDQVRAAARLTKRERRCPARPWSGRSGEHTDALVALLAELQSVARANPEATW
jgi:ring-1,2-phenylacetyl-CoA epoxidase subunit PaaC